MANKTNPDYKQINSFLQAAASQGVDRARTSNSGVFNDVEEKALKKLSPDELQELARIYDKLSNAADTEGAAEAAWQCNVC